MNIKLKNKPYFIAEIGINHNGYLKLAKKMIIEAKKAGADAVKFQKRNINELLNFGLKPQTAKGYLSKHENDTKHKLTKYGAWTYPDVRLELTNKDYIEIKNFCKKIKVDLIITPWDDESAKFIKKLGVKFFKIASIDANNYQFCEFIAKMKHPTIISTGMLTYNEVLRTQKIFKKYKTPHIFLHCTSAYPTDEKDKNLNCIPVMSRLLKDEVGFSGHGVTIAGSAGAVALGAVIVEKHVTLNKKMLGSDHAASLEYHEFKQLVDVCKKIKISLGSSVKKFNKSEQVLQNILLRKFVLSKNITKGAKLTKNNFKTALTMTKYGIHPKFYYNLIGKKVKRNLNKGHVLKLSDIK
jgi:N,N'-diacetyllegionaminate synthase|tara:strand:+ start:243 stop:1301 length:1059 start_codon:yes stop_codon:yes gene_type:complete